MRRTLKELCRWDVVKEATDAMQLLCSREKRIIAERFTIAELLNAPLFLLRTRLELASKPPSILDLSSIEAAGPPMVAQR
jgi:hypothetical protein